MRFEIRGVENSPANYAAAQTNLGFAHFLLAEARDTIQNCRKAIKFFEEDKDRNEL